jgi:hypothetical protein
MPEIRTVTTLKRKRAEIAASIKLYEKHLAQARSDLAHVAAAIRIFEASGKPSDLARYVDTCRLFKRGEPWAICQARSLPAPQGHPRAIPGANEGQGHGYRRQGAGEGPHVPAYPFPADVLGFDQD